MEIVELPRVSYYVDTMFNGCNNIRELIMPTVTISVSVLREMTHLEEVCVSWIVRNRGESRYETQPLPSFIIENAINRYAINLDS